MANTEKVKIVYSVLKQQVEELGWKAEQVSEHYGLNKSQVKALMQKTGLNFRKKAPAFEIIMDEEELVENDSPMNEEVLTQAENILAEAQDPFKVELQDLPQGEQMEEIVPLESLFNEQEVKETPTINQFWK